MGGSMNDIRQSIILESKLALVKGKNQEMIWVGWIVLEVGVRCLRPVKAKPGFLAVQVDYFSIQWSEWSSWVEENIPKSYKIM